MSFAAHRDALAGGRHLRVVNYHNTPAGSRDALRAELARYRERFVPVGLDELDQFFATGRWTDDRPGFLAMFYEGYRNSANVAAPVCEELGIAGWFLVCTGFVDCPVAEQEAYARAHYIDLVPEDLAEPGRRLAMTWDEVAELSRRHVVTPHTASHCGLADVATTADVEREIVGPKRRIDEATGQSAPAFVWLHGSPRGLSEWHDRAVSEAGYRYHISNTMITRIA